MYVICVPIQKRYAKKEIDLAYWGLSNQSQNVTYWKYYQTFEYKIYTAFFNLYEEFFTFVWNILTIIFCPVLSSSHHKHHFTNFALLPGITKLQHHCQPKCRQSDAKSCNHDENHNPPTSCRRFDSCILWRHREYSWAWFNLRVRWFYGVAFILHCVNKLACSGFRKIDNFDISLCCSEYHFEQLRYLSWIK